MTLNRGIYKEVWWPMGGGAEIHELVKVGFAMLETIFRPDPLCFIFLMKIQMEIQKELKNIDERKTFILYISQFGKKKIDNFPLDSSIFLWSRFTATNSKIFEWHFIIYKFSSMILIDFLNE